MTDAVTAQEHIPYVHLADASSQDHSIADRQFPGLHNDTSYIWAMADTADGKRWEAIRSVSKNSAWDFTLHECSTDLSAHPTNLRFPGEDELYVGGILWLEDAGKHVLFPINMTLAAKHPLTLELGPDRYVWKEEHVLDIVLNPMPVNVTRIYVPGLPDDVGYTSSGCTVSGEINGSEIIGGYGGLDRVYCQPEVSSLTSKIAELEHYWFVWASLMEDGTWETGNAMLGSGNYATATFRRPGESPIVATNDDVHAKVIWEAAGDVSQPRYATISFGGRTFNFEGTHNAASAGVSMGIAWLHGTVQEEGGPTPVGCWSTMEVIKVRATPRD